MNSITNKVVVTLKYGVDVDAFIDEMSNKGNISPHVPNREVDIFNLKEESLRVVDFIMTFSEMEELKKDSRVLDCRWGSKMQNGMSFKLHSVESVNGTYTRSSSFRQSESRNFRNDDINWALKDCYHQTNPFVSSSITDSTRAYTLDGENVDIVIFDTGIQADHPEFQDQFGNSRVKKIDWFNEARINGTMPDGFYTDYNGHGTNVASIAAGKNYGWAKKANIYVMNAFGENSIVQASESEVCVITTAYSHMCKVNDQIVLSMQIGSWGPFKTGQQIVLKVKEIISPTKISIQWTTDGNVWKDVNSTLYGKYTPHSVKFLRIIREEYSNVSLLYPGGTIPFRKAFQLIRSWHNLKPKNPKTGIKNPTIVNCSFGININLSNFDLTPTEVVYRGTTYKNDVNNSQTEDLPGYPLTSENIGDWQSFGLFPAVNINGEEVNDGLTSTLGINIPGWDEATNADAADCIRAGVILVGSAGNSSYKIDIPGGDDYDNKLVFRTPDNSYYDVYYHRGSSPVALNMKEADLLYGKKINANFVCVGAIDYTYDSLGLDGKTKQYSYLNSTAKSYFSETGPRVDVYAPGGMIAGAYATHGSKPTSGPVRYFLDENYFSAKDSGTSQAAPQVTGVISCVLQANPTFTQYDVQKWIKENSASKIADVGDNEYTNLFSLQGGQNRYLYFPYQSPDSGVKF